jgi:signal transduction histidine kinase
VAEDTTPADAASTEQARIASLLDSFIAVAEDLDLEAILERTVAAACRATNARFGALGVLGAVDTTRLSHFVTVGFDDETIAALGNYPEGHGVLGLLIREPRPIRITNLMTHPESYGFPPGHPQMESFLGVPIRVRDRVFGNLYLTEKIGEHDFTLDDEHLAIAVAAAAGVAIENSRLYEQTNARRNWLQASIDVEQLILQRASDDEIFDYLCERIAPLTAGLTVRIIDRGDTIEPTMLAEAADVAELDNEPDAWGHALIAPLTAPHRNDVAILIAAPAGTDLITRQLFEHATTFAGRVSRSIEIAEAQSLRERLAVLEDRDRIALDLHDLVIQRLFAAGLSIQGLRRYMQEDAAHARVDAVTREIDESIRELRRTIYSLGNPDDTARGVRAAILAVTSKLGSTVGFEPVVRLSGPLDTTVDDTLGSHLVAVLTEALSNAARHSGAQSIEIEVTASSDELQLVVADDGVGMAEGGRESGLRNMRQRAADLGGNCSIISAPDEGLRLEWVVPLSRVTSTSA